MLVMRSWIGPLLQFLYCPDCGHVSGDNRVTQAEFVCVACGYTANADVVGALNIEHRAGLALREAPAA